MNSVFTEYYSESSYSPKFYRFGENAGTVNTDSSKNPMYFEHGFSAGLMHDTCKEAGFEKTDESQKANIIIGSKLDNGEIYTNLLGHQRITHFRYTRSVGIKIGLHILMTNFYQKHGFYPSFYPQSFLIPEQLDEFRKEAYGTPQLWIEKPTRGSCGRGIRIVKGFPNQFVTSSVLMQKYIRNPLLIRGCKFDLRFYVALESLDPLIIYNYSDGLVRIAVEPYCPHFDDTGALCAHLTNFSINKENPDFKATEDVETDGTGNKWSHAPFWPLMESLCYDVEKLKKEIDDAVVLILMCAREQLLKQENHRNSFELYGFDVLIDSDGNIHILEVNISPALGRSSKLDRHIKTPLVRDWLNMSLVPNESNPSEPDDEELKGFMKVVELEIREQRKGNFRRIYPTRERIESHSRFLERITPFDKLLSRYVNMSDDEKRRYYNMMKPKLDRHFKPAPTSCQVC